MSITILDLAKHRGAKEDPRGGFSMEAIEATGLPFFAGCTCTASLAAFNAYPSKTFYIRCSSCIGSDGFETVEEANAAIFPPEDDGFACGDSEECECEICNPMIDPDSIDDCDSRFD